MSQSSRTARVLEAARQTLAPPPSSIGVDWMAAALFQMEAPLSQAGSPLLQRMINSLGKVPTAVIGVGVCLTFLLLKININISLINIIINVIFSSEL